MRTINWPGVVMHAVNYGLDTEVMMLSSTTQVKGGAMRRLAVVMSWAGMTISFRILLKAVREK